MSEWMQRVLESKRAVRTRLAALPFSQKLALLEKLRERRIAITSSSLRRHPTTKSVPRQSGKIRTEPLSEGATFR
jgi:hypothetical protein